MQGVIYTIDRLGNALAEAERVAAQQEEIIRAQQAEIARLREQAEQRQPGDAESA